MLNKDPVLSFEEFRNEGAGDSFRLHFAGENPGDSYIADSYREQMHYQLCIRECPRFAVLSETLRKRPDYLSDGYLELLYEAYTLMRRYAAKDADMFT